MLDTEVKELMQRLSCTLFNGSQSGFYKKNDVLTAIKSVLIDYNHGVSKDLQISILDFRDNKN